MSVIDDYKSTRLELLDNRIVHCKAFRNDLYTEQDLKKLFELMMSVSNTDKLLVLMNLTEGEIVLTKGARRYFQEDYMMEKNIMAEAVLMRSTISQIIYSSILKFNKPKFPFKAFSNESKAIEWLNKHSIKE
jgi:hypothetical protein